MKKFLNVLEHEAMKYLFFGVLTTVVYYIVMLVSFNMLKTSSLPAGTLSEVLGQAISIIFAFITNKIWVFEHKSDNIIRDFISFATGRLVFMFLAVALKWWFVDMHSEILTNALHMTKTNMVMALSLAIQFLNIVLNYFYSKFIVFRKRKVEETNNGETNEKA